MAFLKQSTATTIKLGPFVDSTDGDTEEAGLTIQKADVFLSKDGGAYTAAGADQGVGDVGAPYDTRGEYEISLNTTDTNTLGTLQIVVHMSGALIVKATFNILPANVYESWFGADRQQVDITHVNNSSVVIGDFQADVSGLSTFDASTDAVANVTLVDTVTANTDMRGTDNASTFDASSDGVNIDRVNSAPVTSVNDFKADVSSISDDVLNSIVEDNGSGTTWTMKQMLRLIFAPLCGERAGGGLPGAKTFNVPGGSKTRVTVTTDVNGNTTTNVTLDDTDA